jgi:hypothetical protein
MGLMSLSNMTTYLRSDTITLIWLDESDVRLEPVHDTSLPYILYLLLTV